MKPIEVTISVVNLGWYFIYHMDYRCPLCSGKNRFSISSGYIHKRWKIACWSKCPGKVIMIFEPKQKYDTY